MLAYLDIKSLAPCFGLLLLAHSNTAATALSSLSFATIRCSHSLACTFVFVFVYVADPVVRFRTLALAPLLLGCRFVC